MKGLIFNCDDALLGTEDLERQAYNATFDHFNVTTKGSVFPVDWTEEDYAMLRNRVAPGTPGGLRNSPADDCTALMRQYFKQAGWPTSDLSASPPKSEQDQAQLLETLTRYHQQCLQDMVKDGDLETRPGVLRVMDEARAAGIKVGVCAIGNKLPVRPAIEAALGQERYNSLACVLTAEDVPDSAKPSPAMYRTAAERMGVAPEECVVVEGCAAGLQAAREAGMRCVITYTPSSKMQSFPGAERIVSALGFPANITVEELKAKRIVQDDRWEMTVTESGIYFHAPDQM